MNDHRRPWFSWVYRRLAPGLDERGSGRHRERLVAGLSGTVVEVGAGTGLTFPRYRPPVGRVEAIEPEPSLRADATVAARDAHVDIRVHAGVAESLPLPDASADAAVSSLVLCSVSDLEGALSELARVVRPGGALRLYEHVRAPTPLLASVQARVDPLWSRVAGGCHTARDPLAAAQEAGFTLDRVHRFRVPPAGPTLPPSPHVLVEATRRTARAS